MSEVQWNLVSSLNKYSWRGLKIKKLVEIYSSSTFTWNLINRNAPFLISLKETRFLVVKSAGQKLLCVELHVKAGISRCEIGKKRV
jgi:hypothetical protein